MESYNKAILYAILGGFFSGDGCIKTTSSVSSAGHRNYVPHLQVTSISNDILFLLKKTFGGTITMMRKRKGGDGHIYEWRFSGDSVMTALGHMKPYIIGKASQVNIIMAWPPRKQFKIDATGTRKKRMDIHSLLQSLKKEVPEEPIPAFGRVQAVCFVGGFFGADGCVYAYNPRESSITVMFDQKHRHVLDCINTWFPSISGVKDHVATCQSGRFPCFRLGYTGQEALDFLSIIVDYVPVDHKREQCRVVIDPELPMEEKVKRLKELKMYSE